MKVVLKDAGGPSPGIRIIGERQDLLALASIMREKIEQSPPDQKSEIPFIDSSACDGSREWISLQIVSDIDPIISGAEKKGRHLVWGIWILFAAGAAILALAYLGVMSLIQ